MNFGAVSKRTFTWMADLIVKEFGIWIHGKPDVVAEAPLYTAKITCVMITGQQGRHRVLYFLEDVSGDTQTVNAQRYRAVLAKFRRALKTKQKNDMEALQ